MKNMKKKTIVICFTIIFVLVGGLLGTNYYKNNYTDKGKKKQCVVNYIKNVNKGNSNNQYESKNFMSTLEINTYKKYKITSVEDTREVKTMKVYGGYVVANTIYVDRDGKQIEKQLAFFVARKDNKSAYKVSMVTPNR